MFEEHPNTPADIRSYYDQNTRLFLKLGSSKSTQSIHRAVWAAGVDSLDAALNHTNSLILEQAQLLRHSQTGEQLRLVDLGCGAGGSLAYLLRRLEPPPRAAGLTISGVQAYLAQQKLNAACAVLQADFHSIPLAAGFDLAYAIEAYVHASRPERFMAEAARLLRPGGRLVICDDFLSDEAGEGLTAPQQRWLEAYQGGWYVPNVRTPQTAATLAQSFRLAPVQDLDLTPYLRLRSLPDPLARLLLWTGTRLPLKHAILPSMLGSLALQQCLHMGVVHYRCLVFEKQG